MTKTAMILAGGLGLRMRPLTLTRPKPLIEVCGKALIDYGLDKLREAGVEKAVVNVHHHPEQIEAWARRQSSPRIEISDERDLLLDTGGGIVHALPKLGKLPFFVLNSDSFWTDQGKPALARLSETWDSAIMDCLLLVCPFENTVGYSGKGDFVMASDGRLKRLSQDNSGGLVYIGAYLMHPRILADALGGKFSMNLLWNKLIEQGRLFGVVHKGLWMHVGTPDAIALAEAAMNTPDIVTPAKAGDPLQAPDPLAKRVPRLRGDDG